MDMKKEFAIILTIALLASSVIFVFPASQATSSDSENVTFAEAIAGTSHIVVSPYYTGAIQPFTIGSAPVKISWVDVYAASPSHDLQIAIGTTLEEDNVWSVNLTTAPPQAAWLNQSVSPAVALKGGTVYYVTVSTAPGQNYIGTINGWNAGSWFIEKNLVSPMFSLTSSGPVETNSTYLAFTVGGMVPVYNVTFQLSNAISSQWTVDLSGVNQSSSSSSVTFSEPNGTYQFTIPDVVSNGVTYVASPDSGTVVVSGTNRNVSISFIDQVYSVTFGESGLSSNTEWWVNITGGPSLHSNTSEISFKEPNGFVYFTVEARGYSATPSSGTLPISGKNVSISVSFEKATNGSGTIIYNNNTVKNYLSQDWPFFIMLSLIFILAGWALSYYINPENKKVKK
jgi:hypothetical protein